MSIEKLTPEQALVISGYTGFLACSFSDLHGDIEKRLGRPVWTHQIPDIRDEIKEVYRDDFLAMIPEEVLS